MICLDVLHMFEQYAYVNIHTPTYSFLLSFSAWFLSRRGGSRGFFWCSQHVGLLFHLQLSGATIFPLCVRMPRIIRRGAVCLREIAGYWFFDCFCLSRFFSSSFPSFWMMWTVWVSSTVQMKVWPLNGTRHSRQHRLTITVSSRDFRPKTLIWTNSTWLELDKMSVSWVFSNSFLRETAHLGTLAWWKGCQVPWLQLHCAPALRVWHQVFTVFFQLLECGQHEKAENNGKFNCDQCIIHTHTDTMICIYCIY